MKKRGLLSTVLKFPGERRGAALVEFAIAVPFLLLLALGVAEFGRALQHHHLVNKSVRDAARYLGRTPIECSGPGSVQLDNGTTGLSEARQMAIYGTMADGAPPILSYWTEETTVTASVACVENTGLRGRAHLAMVRVQATVPYQDIGFLSILGLGPITLRADHEQFVIGE